MSFFEKLKSGVGIEVSRENQVEKIELKKKSRGTKKIKAGKEEKEEFQSDGQLAIDVYETEEGFVIQSTIAGVKAEDLDISIENDLVTIRGSRKKPDQRGLAKYFYQECYWGPFSRQVILPEEVNASEVEAKMKDGVLTLLLPKVHKSTKKKIEVAQEE